MKKILPLVILALISCVSYKPVYLDLSMLMLEGQGEGRIVQSKCQGETILIETEDPEKMIEIRFDGVTPSRMKNLLCRGSEYYYSSYLRPDGPVEYLKLSDAEGLLAYLGDGLRLKNVPGMDLEISMVQSDDQRVELSSSEGSWIVKTGKPETVLIEGVEFTVHLLNLQRGDPEFDQPPLKVDLILIRE